MLNHHLMTITRGSVRMRSTATAHWLNGDAADQVKPYEEMPGPKALPVIGNVWRFLPIIGEYAVKDPFSIQKRVHEKYGDIVRLSGILGRPDIVFTFNPSDAEIMYRNEGAYPSRPAMESWERYYKTNKMNVTKRRLPLLSLDGKEWHSLRSAVQQPIMQPRTAKMYISSVEQVASDFIDRIRSLRDTKNEMPDDFHNELYKWSLESIGLIALDTRLGCLSPNLSLDSEPQRIINAVQDLFAVLPSLELGSPLWKYFRTSNWKKFEKSLDTFSSLAVKYISQAVETLKRKPKDSEDELTLLQRLLKYDPDPTTALLISLDLLVGAIDTTSLSSANLMYLLAKNPEKQRKLLNEINCILPSKETRVTAEKLNSMNYMRACLKESLRIAPIAIAGGGRIIPKDVVLSGYKVPKGTVVLFGLAMVGVDSRHFPLADEFIPERWLRGEDKDCPFSKEEQDKVHPFASLPFGHGPRMCIGRRFAEMEMQMLVLKVLQNFEVQFNYETKFSTEASLFYTLTGPMKFTFKDRK